MKKPIVLLSLCLVFAASTAAGPAPSGQTAEKEPLTLTYVANSGVLVMSGDSKVLIDALFDRPNPDYRAPAPEVLDKIMKGAAPFDGVDLVLVTHDHPDHFDAGVAVRYLEALPGPVLMAPADAVAEMRKAAADWTKIEPRVVSLDLKVGGKEERKPARIPVTAFRTLHSGDKESPMNLMYLFELNGRRIFHEGDSNGKPEVFKGFGLGAAPVDLALVHYWFPLEPNCAKFLQEVFRPDHVALTHLPIRLESDAPGKIDLVRQYYKDIFLMLPGMPARIFPQASPQDQDILTAVKNGDLEQVKTLLKQNPELIRTKDQYKNSLLRVALLKNDFFMAGFLIESGIDVNYGREDTGGNEIFGAIQVGSLEITKLIFKKGVDINLKDKQGTTPLESAIYGGKKEIVDFLLDEGAVLNVDEQNLPSLMRAALRGGIDKITNLLIKRKNVDYKNVDGLGNTFLHAAAQSGETTYLGYLIEKRLNPNTRNVYGWTSLHYAAYKGYRNVIDALLRSGANKNVRTKDGKTPFNIAEELGPKDTVPYLKEKGLDTGPAEFPKLEAKYIDPNLPGEKRARFAPGIISQPHHFEHSKCTFSEDMKTACWADWQRTGISKIFVMENKDNLWQAPRVVLLKATQPSIAPDGKKIYFTAPRILPDGKEARDSDIFYIEKTEMGWSERVNLGPNVNTEADEIEPTVTRDDTVYFSHKADIYRSKLIGGRYAPKQKLPAPINTDSTQDQPYIAPDESFLLFSSLGQGGVSEPNYYYSSRNADGTWTEPVNIAKKVKDAGPFPIGLFPSLTPDRKYMIYFLAPDLYWFDISAIMNELIKPGPAAGEQTGRAAPSGPGWSRETLYGQPAPGAEPVKFCPEVLTSEKHPHGQLAFSPDGTGVFWSAMLADGPEQTIFYSAFDGKTFSRPVVAPFAAASGNGGPAFSADGKRLFFNAELPPSAGSSAGREAICYVDKTASGWTRPVPIESTVDDRMTKGQVSVARSGNIYFTGRVLAGGTPGIFICRYSNGKYLAPEKLVGPLATMPHVLDPWVDPDEKFLLVSCPPQEVQPVRPDIGISFRQPDGSWGIPVRLGGAVNTEAHERFPSLTRDGKYLFFIRSLSPQFVGDQAHFYWVDANAVDALRREPLK